MQERLLIRTASDASVSNLDPAMAPRLARRKRVLLADPSHFRVEYAINPHMRTPDGKLQNIDAKRAATQWEALRDAYKELGLRVDVLPADARFADMVFAANQAFPYPDPIFDKAKGSYCFVPSRMAYAEREGEVPFYSEWFRAQGYRETPIPATIKGTFEGGGDLTWFGDKRILVGGTGRRTSVDALKAVADLVEAPMVVLELDDPDFFHLDTCLNFLDDTTALWVRNAFKPNTQKLLAQIVENLIDVDDLEARRGLACNGHSPDGRRVLLQKGNRQTLSTLEGIGYDVIEVDTSEFIKAGGSVFCLKMMLW